jgi:nucleotide-binding universal stress UspA family protein
MVRQILIPLDGSALAETARPVGEAVAALTGADVTLMQDVTPLGPLLGLSEDDEEVRLGWEYETAAERDAHDYLAAVARRLAARQINARVRVAVGSPAEQILRASATMDLIVMATHGRGGLDRWSHGSVADRVLRAAPAPLLLVRAGAAATAAPQPADGHVVS